MSRVQHFTVVLPGRPGNHAPPRVVTVRPTGEFDNGHPVYADLTGGLRVRITQNIAHVLSDPDGCRGRCVAAVPQFRPAVEEPMTPLSPPL